MADITPMPPMRDQVQFEGSIKDRPDDFLVYEIPKYEPCGEGEHLYLRIRKSGVSHDDLISTVARACSVPVRAIGFAGIKDTKAVTEQTLSVHRPDSDHAPVIDDDRIEVLWMDRHRNKLRRGHLAGNLLQRPPGRVDANAELEKIKKLLKITRYFPYRASIE